MENEKKDFDNQQNKPLSKEEMARMIAKNLNASYGSDEDNSSVPGNYFGEEEYKDYSRSAIKAPQKPSQREAGNYDSEEDEEEYRAPRKKKKKHSAGKKAAAVTAALIAVIAVTAGSFYLVGMSSRTGVFLDNTYINGIDVSGKSEAEAYKLLQEEKNTLDTVVIEKLNGTKSEIKISELGYVDDTKARVSQYYSQQNHYTWFLSKFKKTDFNWTSEFNYKKDELEKILKKRIVEDKEVIKPQNAKIIENDDGTYSVEKEKGGTKINPSKAKTLYDYVEEQMDSGNYNIDISNIDIYQTADVTSQKLQPTCDRLNSLSDMEIEFDFTYTKEKLKIADVMDWIDIDANGGTYTVDEDKAMKYVESLAEKYDTYGKSRKFKSTKRGVVTIPKGEGCYGWWIDQEKTKDLIVETIEAGESDTVEPIYFVSPDSGYSYTCNPEWRTKDKDYSNTYIEVDLTNQHLWYYKNGKKVMETPIVSGFDGDDGRKTPAGAYKLWLKERSKTLVGSGQYSYSSYVDYWNNISTIGIGLHDASWQDGDFNSSKYHSSTWGSHGCINMPFDKAQYVYDNIDEGTPVFLYY